MGEMMKSRWTSGLLGLWLGLAVFAALPCAALAETRQEIAVKILKALRELSFTADLVLTTTEEGETVLAGKLYRMPPDRFRLERWDKNGLSDYLLEDRHLSIRVFPRERRAYAMRRHQLMPVFGMMGVFTEGAVRQGKADMQEAVAGGAKVYVFSSKQPGSPVKFVVSASDYLPRELVLGFDRQSEAVVLKLTDVEVAKKQLPEELFVVPEGYSVVGFPKGIGERERALLRQLQERNRQQLGQGGGPRAEEDYLPVLPSYLPKGFDIYTVTPLYFTDNLIFHVEIINPSHSQLISLFETQNEKFGSELKNSSFARERQVLFGEHEESGLFVLLMSEDVQVGELRRVLDSLEDQPELSAKLIDEALQRLLGG